MTRTAFITHPECQQHTMGAGHPESPQRLAAILDALKPTKLWSQLVPMEAPRISRRALERAHHADLIEQVFRSFPVQGFHPLGEDVVVNSHSLNAALYAAGAACFAVDKVISGEVVNAFCAVRPPGHHATRSKVMGFCIFNNIAVAALHAVAVHGLKRVAIVDFDVHHGNGTEDIVQGNPNLLFCSSFQYPFYPYTDISHPASNVLLTPLAANSTSEVFRSAITQHWLPRLLDFQPELILVSAGFDAHTADPLASLQLDETDFYWITHELVSIAQQCCQGRLVSSLEGGYDLNGLAQSVVQHLAALQ